MKHVSVYIVYSAIMQIMVLSYTCSAAEMIVDQYLSDEEKATIFRKPINEWTAVRRWKMECDMEALAGDGIPSHRIMAAAAPGDYYELTAHSVNSIPWQFDPFATELFIHQEKCVRRKPFNRIYQEIAVTIGGSLPENPGLDRLDIVLPIIPRWPLSDYQHPNNPMLGSPATLAGAIESSQYRLLKGLETVGGQECYVLDYNGLDRVWVASERGLCLMRRDKRSARSHDLMERYLTDAMFHIRDGLWLPQKYRVQSFASGHGDHQRVVREVNVHVLRITINDDVPDSDFVVRHSPGSVRLADPSGHSIQMSEGGEDLLENIIHFTGRYAGLPTGRGLGRNYVLIFVCGLLIGWLAATLALHRSARSRV